jgi:ketosteroid isomerase-like protein
MTDLKNQLRTYYEATTQPVDVAEIAVDPDNVVVGQIPQAAQRRSTVNTQGTKETTSWWQGPLVAVSALVAVIAVVVAVVLITNDSSSDSAADLSPRAVLLDFQDAYNAGDLSQVMDLFADEAVVNNYPGTRILEGRDQIATRLNSERNDYNAAYEMSDIGLAGNTVTFRHRWSHAGGCGTAAGHQMVVTDGLIAEWVFPTVTASC